MPLQARREIGRVADDGLLLGSTFSYEIADDHEASRDADTHLEFCQRPASSMSQPRLRFPIPL
jgi:hypothetical protein